MAREIDALLRVTFTALHKTGAPDVEAVEMALRALSLFFIHTVAEYKFGCRALGSNDLRVSAGGMLESASLWTVIRSLIILAATLHLFSFLFLR